MSIFRPHKTKPRQFNYTPRYYDPLKEAFNQRRRELHGTSSETDDLPYAPGDYLRMQSEARRESRESQSKASSNRLLRYGVLIVVVGMGFSLLMPRIVDLLTRFMGAGETTEIVDTADGVIEGDSTTYAIRYKYMEHAPVDYVEDEIDFDFNDKMSEVEEWNRMHQNINIYTDDVEIVDGKRVESKE